MTQGPSSNLNEQFHALSSTMDARHLSVSASTIRRDTPTRSVRLSIDPKPHIQIGTKARQVLEDKCPLIGLSMGERTGSRVFQWVWSLFQSSLQRRGPFIVISISNGGAALIASPTPFSLSLHPYDSFYNAAGLCTDQPTLHFFLQVIHPQVTPPLSSQNDDVCSHDSFRARPILWLLTLLALALVCPSSIQSPLAAPSPDANAAFCDTGADRCIFPSNKFPLPLEMPALLRPESTTPMQLPSTPPTCPTPETAPRRVPFRRARAQHLQWQLHRHLHLE
ncbi:hypothetical protein CcaCcLH18_10119 [Colletotrichum camelliae]|nr:hypothetical protein CcaCcLH18_10119 [Colletotrichum camelliae]